MKKRVAAIVIIAVLTLFLAASNGHNSLTGFQPLDLPEPPAPPGMESDQLLPTNVSPVQPAQPAPKPVPKTEETQSVLARLDAIDQKLGVLPAWEQRLSAAEGQLKVSSDASSRIDALQSQVDAVKVDVENLKQRPSFEA